jgi:two-component system chemotaxis sensor kinase CheA
MDELIKDFLADTAEALTLLDSELVHLEATRGDPVTLASIFRKLHTIKGTCGFLGFPRLGRLAHAGETVLVGLREGTLKTTPGVIDAILRCVDAIKDLVATIETTGTEGPADHARLLAELHALHEGCIDIASCPGAGPHPNPSGRAPSSPASAGEGCSHWPNIPPPGSAPSGQAVRISVGLLEGLMTTVAELVLTRNQLLQLLRAEPDSAFGPPLQLLSILTSKLQDGILKARMQPVGTAWTALPRLVRDLAQELGKKIELHMQGADTELDRQVLELIKDPLTHMVRNAADHGLETPAARRAAGKAETGHIRLNAFHEGGHIVIEVSDDGSGLDAERIRRKAIQNGLVGAAEAASLAEAQLFRLIMCPGFSTAAAVTAVSGRGVGMDVVRANIEKIGGTIGIASRPGRGASFSIKIPLTLATISALIKGGTGEPFAAVEPVGKCASSLFCRASLSGG